MLLSTANIVFGRDGVGVGRSGVADGLSIGVGDFFTSLVGAGEGVIRTLGTGVGAGYLPLVSPADPRVMIHAMRTPEAPRTRTIANTHGNGLLRGSPRAPSALTCGGAI
ncbi:MAG TPA: hypothetical protein VEM96_07040 [Pyrinomonadaceae bacterium]|nr:hypothetical protein [Pyrinomonadaceae bacterium]